MYKHILFATELGEDSRQIGDKVSQMAALANSRVTVLHVIEPMPSAYAMGEIGVYFDAEEEKRKVKIRALDSLKPCIANMNVSESDVVIATGIVSKKVLAYAEEYDADLIIVGSHGRHGLQLLLGSNANAILHGAKCDVLAVRLK